MGRDDAKLSSAKMSYQNAKAVGNHHEEARWANVIGDILKNKGEYVQALKWLKIDYDVSVKYLPQKHCLPTCQSLGELYLRLEYFEEALFYQKKHLELAKDTNDLVEQQRASTQLGRTYHEMFLRSEDDHCSVRNAKKYFRSAMKLAQTLKENQHSKSNCSFLKEYIDAHNNIGMLEMDLDNLEEAQKILRRGLEICDEEEVIEDDDGRSRLHHNLGNVYMELRMWDEAREHIEKDILICKRIGHCQGEAKGYINLGELHNRVQKYDEALCCYQKAIDLGKSMEDEDALVRQIEQNIKIVKEAISVLGDLKKEEQNFKKLTRELSIARGTPCERKCLLQQITSLDCLLEKARMIYAWSKLREFAKSKKRIASELCDTEKLSDSLLAIGESYYKLRKFSKAIKWYMKSWEVYKSIGNQEGQAMVKINIGDVLDSDGNWQGALDAFEESYRIAVQANLHSMQLLALENMHYSHMIRFDNFEEARRLQLLIDQLKKQSNREPETQDLAEGCCSETDTEEEIRVSSETSKSNSSRSKSVAGVEELNDDVPLISLLRSTKRPSKMETTYIGSQNTSTKPAEFSPKCLSKSNSDQQTIVGRKRVRVILSDDEDDMHDEVESSKGRTHNNPVKDVAKSNEFKDISSKGSPVSIIQDISTVESKCVNSSCNLVKIEESFSSYKTTNPYVSTQSGKCFRSSSNDEVAIASGLAASSSKCETDVSENLLHKQNLKPCIIFKIGEELICAETSLSFAIDTSCIEALKVELACLYYLQLPVEKRSEGLFPIIQLIKFGERVIESMEAIVSLKDHTGKVFLEAFIEGWVQKRLIKLYVDCCKESSETPNMKLLKKLYDLEVSDDEVVVSECDLQDLSITPLLNALHAHKTFAMLDLSHNFLGNGTMEKLQQVFTLSGPKYGGLMLDLHCNRFGPTSLFQICECPVLFARLEVLNLSGNRLTDACASYLSTILENCQALCSLNIERCFITSRTIQKVADALSPGSVLEQLCIGHNNPVTGSAITNLLVKLANLKRFSKLHLNGLKLSKPVIDRLSQLAKSSSLSSLMLGETGIGTDGALQVTESLFNLNEESVKLDLSYCGLTSKYVLKINTNISLVCGIIELNLTGNPIMQEASDALSSLLLNPQCCLKVLVLSECQLGVVGILQIVHSLSGNGSLEELNLADNVQLDKYHPPQHDITKQSSELMVPNFSTSKSSPKICVPEEVEPSQPDLCIVNTDCNQLEVADSEDDLIKVEAATFGIDDSCASSSQRNFSPPERQFIQDLSTAISEAKKLILLDLSNNGFSTEAADMLYSAWSSSRVGSAHRHIKDQTIHLTTEGSKCCVKPCCRKD
ncbi:protein TONSOKU [Ziziphus jujuba]|uniref:Protein TONSOKU n=1 Tax=Ziziphus jujuba TaxID=326968 RepID=A0A6P4AYA7_ZIZJJ|nr:protein TONSOKU [Ziziphus jujuba]